MSVTRNATFEAEVRFHRCARALLFTIVGAQKLLRAAKQPNAEDVEVILKVLQSQM